MTMPEAQMQQHRELLARLDRIATISRGHRAGLHLQDHKLLEQYLAVLAAWRVQAPEELPVYSKQAADPRERLLVRINRA